MILSRSDPEFVKQLLIQEVPELHDGNVEICKIVRIAGYRTKVTVISNDMRIDAVGACIGTRGIRVKNIVRELNNEKIDIMPHSADPIELLQNALAPIEIRKLGMNEDKTKISIVVDDENFAVVIGKKGMNAHLNSKLIEKELDVQRLTEYNRALEFKHTELANSKDPSLDEPLQVDNVSTLILEALIDAGYDTPRKLLIARTEEVTKLPGINKDLLSKILEQISKKKNVMVNNLKLSIKNKQIAQAVNLGKLKAKLAKKKSENEKSKQETKSKVSDDAKTESKIAPKEEASIDEKSVKEQKSAKPYSQTKKTAETTAHVKKNH